MSLRSRLDAISLRIPKEIPSVRIVEVLPRETTEQAIERLGISTYENGLPVLCIGVHKETK